MIKLHLVIRVNYFELHHPQGMTMQLLLMAVYRKPLQTYRTLHRLNCCLFTEMALSAVKTFINSGFRIIWIVCAIRTWKLLCHTSATWTVIPWRTVTSGFWFSTWTVLSFGTNVTLGGIEQVRTIWVCSRRARKLCWCSCPCYIAWNKTQAHD